MDYLQFTLVFASILVLTYFSTGLVLTLMFLFVYGVEAVLGDDSGDRMINFVVSVFLWPLIFLGFW